MRKEALKHRVTFRKSKYDHYDVILTEVYAVGELVEFPDGWVYFPDHYSLPIAFTDGASLEDAKRAAEEYARGQL